MAHMAPCGRVACDCSCGKLQLWLNSRHFPTSHDSVGHAATCPIQAQVVKYPEISWNILKFMIFHGMQSRADIDFMWFHDILCHIDPFWERFIRSVGTCWDSLEVSCSSFIRFLRRVAFCRHRCLFSAAGLAICCYRLGIFWNLFWM